MTILSTIVMCKEKREATRKMRWADDFFEKAKGRGVLCSVTRRLSGWPYGIKGKDVLCEIHELQCGASPLFPRSRPSLRSHFRQYLKTGVGRQLMTTMVGWRDG